MVLLCLLNSNSKKPHTHDTGNKQAKRKKRDGIGQETQNDASERKGGGTRTLHNSLNRCEKPGLFSPTM